MLEELTELGAGICEQKYGEWNHVALKEEPVSIDMVIENDGSFCKFELLEKNTIAEVLTSKKGKARLLLDKAEEILGFGSNTDKKHQWFLEKLNRYGDLPEISPVMAFYYRNKENGLDKALQEFVKQIPDEKNRKGNLAFRIRGKSNRIHEEANVRLRVIKEYGKNYKTGRPCSICGKTDLPVGDIPHGMIKRVPDGQSSGCALVSYNEPAFESYELIGNDNSAVCAGCAKTYVEGLNWLMSDGREIFIKTKKGKEKKEFRYTHRKYLGRDTAIVFWTRNNIDLPEIDQLEAPDPDEVVKLIESISSGNNTVSRYIESDQFYSCTLSGSAARIAVRDWIEVSLSDFHQAIAKWFRDIVIGEYDSDLKKIKPHYAGLYDMARGCQRRNSDGSYDKDDTSPARVAANLWNSALRNNAPSLWILTRVLERSRLDTRGITADRAALIKLILNRHDRGGDNVITENTMSGDRPLAYICGQIFAKLEEIQYWSASGERNAGMRERYFTYAMTLPASAFGRLFDLNSKHYRKLKNEKPGLAINLDKDLQDLVKDVDIQKLPATFSLVQKGQFAIGYYHQKQAQFNKD
ncbi:MAG: type I-C CRISPR-associated protein Cas8c/Csd1 [Dehalococcoidales bacterium]|nr:type I-C CRISPR-associated protein Cas8c/Csd1 [Dehalococcoidales bacterium]